ncbi:Uncharacterised protein [Algoriella xinjiangensis]|uniref:hypothetical protein n=1 Tax=Algoriella xinjiangensis TaxID=684065 RepID=UPI000F6336D2|nr:hypothetical protein [Algoriella xinjiangensis]VDH15450.1 Uncharacterised protein [Algoriella xinjiangensis]
MEKIIHKINILKKVEIFKKIFINDAIDKGIKTEFYCSNCSSQNEINIILYKTGFSFSELYETGILDEKDIIEYKMASKTSENYEYLGKYTVNNLPTLYFHIRCNKCLEKYIIIFSYGEKQPGLEVCEISGAWYYK